MDTSNENIFWTKINGDKINKQNDLYIVTVYNSPINSTCRTINKNDICNQLQDKIATISATDKLIIGGDFNARTAILPDYVNEDANDLKYQNFPNGYEISLTRERNNRDTLKNEYGENQTELCPTTNIRILNGRTLGDLQGEFTYCGIHGLSTVRKRNKR